MSKAKLVLEALENVFKPSSQEDIIKILDQKKDELKGLDGVDTIKKLINGAWGDQYGDLKNWEYKNLLHLIIEDAHGEEQNYVLSKLVEYFYDIEE